MPREAADPESKYAVEERGGAIKAAVHDPARDRALKSLVKNYIGANTHVLATPNVGRRLFFRPEDTRKAHDILGVTEEEMAETVRRHGLTDPGWKIANKTLAWILTLAAREYLLKKDREGAEHAAIYMSLMFYSSIQYKYWRFEPEGSNEAVMQSVLNSLSPKLKLRQVGSVLGLLSEITLKALSTYEADVREGRDLRLLYFIAQVRNRINDAIKNVAHKFYEELEAEKSKRMYVDRGERGRNSDGDELPRRDLENASASVDRLVEQAVNRSAALGVDRRLSDIAAKLCNVSPTALAEALERIARQEHEHSAELCRLILEIHDSEGRPLSAVGTKEFVLVVASAYSKSNSKDPAVLRSRVVLDEMLRSSSERYMQTEREASRAAFRKAVFVYHCLLVQQAYLGR